MEQSSTLAPTTLTEVQSSFADWRKTKQHRSRIPEELWTAAVMLSLDHPLYKISRSLGLNYTDLKERVKKSPTTRHTCRTTPPLNFIPIDLATPPSSECIVEMEHRNGNKMTMHFKGKAELDLQSFAESFWNGRA
jgi:hypothetical protein